MIRHYALHISAITLTLLVALLDGSFVENSVAQILERERPIAPLTLSFSGDVIQHRPQVNAARTATGYDFSGNFKYIDTVWRSVDFAIVNYETTVSLDGTQTMYPRFSAPGDVAAFLRRAGVDVMALANNHCVDKGMAGVRKTLHTMDSLGFMTTGLYIDTLVASRPLMLCRDNYRVALLNYTYSTNGMAIPRGVMVNLIDTLRIKNDIHKARQDSSTHIVAFMHWGVEYQRKANRDQRALASWLRTNGVDVVIGSHPHVVQDIDTALRTVYSLGNFISNQQDQYTDSGLTVKVTLHHDATPKIEYIPHWCDKLASKALDRYRVLTPRDTIIQTTESSKSKMLQALREAREAVGDQARELIIN